MIVFKEDCPGVGKADVIAAPETRDDKFGFGDRGDVADGHAVDGGIADLEFGDESAVGSIWRMMGRMTPTTPSG